MTRAEVHLASADDRLAAVIASTPAPRFARNKDVYLALLQSVASQQLSGKAADTIFGRFLGLFRDGYPHAARVASLSPEQLRAVGFSRQKASYIVNIARHKLTHRMDYEQLEEMSDEEVITHLTVIKGVGRWTVDMLLMFPLNRPDVLPVDDLGIRQAMTSLYRLRSKGNRLKERMMQIAEPWRPHRTLACTYLWKWTSRDGR